MKDPDARRRTVCLITIGQSPRPDIEALFKNYFPARRLCIRGLLDGMSRKAIRAMERSSSDYPLRAVLNDGSRIEMSLHALRPLLQRQINELEKEDVAFAVLLCCGNFTGIDYSMSILFPSAIIAALLDSLCITKRIGIILPNPGQVSYAKQHWASKGFSVHAVVNDPDDLESLRERTRSLELHHPEMLVLDCMGFGIQAREVVQEIVHCPVILPITMIANIAAELGTLHDSICKG